MRMLASAGRALSLLRFACGVSPDRKAEDGAFQEKIHPKLNDDLFAAPAGVSHLTFQATSLTIGWVIENYKKYNNLLEYSFFMENHFLAAAVS
ncbi:hypothetical protein [Peribacillus deserti]|uniref:Uncharacterized protein n=1 Tax=Peribacillus deserti TaxID=673318 RepID=A0A2N5M877_9BACI|nr:hypothetical protein [Peribacillus deserti]PLT30581.1 hypothetical protein CUU66_06980 [Peribacillus deserti]